MLPASPAALNCSTSGRDIAAVLEALLLREAAVEAGLPAGVPYILPGGRELGSYLISHRGVDKVSFTGSSAPGRSIAEVCGRLLRPVTLELGGKSAAIVLDDADPKGEPRTVLRCHPAEQRPDLLALLPGTGAALSLRRDRRHHKRSGVISEAR